MTTKKSTLTLFLSIWLLFTLCLQSSTLTSAAEEHFHGGLETQTSSDWPSRNNQWPPKGWWWWWWWSHPSPAPHPNQTPPNNNQQHHHKHSPPHSHHNSPPLPMTRHRKFIAPLAKKWSQVEKQDPKDCSVALIYVDGCVSDLIASFFDDDNISLNNRSCRVISEISDDCFREAFMQFDAGDFTRKVKVFCDRN